MSRRQRWQLPDPPAPTGAADPGPKLVADIVHALVRAEDPAEAYQFALDRACAAVQATRGAVFLLDPAAEALRPVAAHAWPERWRPWLGEVRLRIGFGPAGEAAAERRLIEVPDVLADPSLVEWTEAAEEMGFRAIVSLPIVAAKGVVGAASFYFDASGPRPAAAKDLLRTVADLLAAIYEMDLVRGRLRLAEAALEDERSAAPKRRDSDATDR